MSLTGGCQPKNRGSVAQEWGEWGWRMGAGQEIELEKSKRERWRKKNITLYKGTQIIVLLSVPWMLQIWLYLAWILKTVFSKMGLLIVPFSLVQTLLLILVGPHVQQNLSALSFSLFGRCAVVKLGFYFVLPRLKKKNHIESICLCFQPFEYDLLWNCILPIFKNGFSDICYWFTFFICLQYVICWLYVLLISSPNLRLSLLMEIFDKQKF